MQFFLKTFKPSPGQLGTFLTFRNCIRWCTLFLPVCVTINSLKKNMYTEFLVLLYHFIIVILSAMKVADLTCTEDTFHWIAPEFRY